MKNLDFFSGESEVIKNNKNLHSKYQKFKAMFNYREAEKHERCGNCENHLGRGYNGKQYHKCKLLGISNSIATDIRVSSVCDKHEKEKITCKQK